MTGMTNPIRPLAGFTLAILIVLMDQLSKWYVFERLLAPVSENPRAPLGLMDWTAAAPERLPFTSMEVTPFFNIVSVWNFGVSFGMFRSDTPYLLIGLAAIISVLFGIWLTRAENKAQVIALGMAIGGAVGNVIDRLRFGAVADFLDFHAFGWHYPAFNVADSCITLGIALLALDALFWAPKRKSDS